jgi:hypothetical protein
MLSSAPGALVKQIIMEIFSWKLCIQSFESIKSYLITITFPFLACLTSTPGAMFSITLYLIIFLKCCK